MKICDSFWSKARGLMFSRRKNLIFVFDDEKRRSLHMLFVFFPIEVLFLNKYKRVVEKARLSPFSFYNSKQKAKYVVEIADEERRNNILFQV